MRRGPSHAVPTRGAGSRRGVVLSYLGRTSYLVLMRGYAEPATGPTMPVKAPGTSILGTWLPNAGQWVIR